jgi:2-phospho-L-lactate guanylyltransferase
MSGIWAIVPVKDMRLSKQRLAPLLDGKQRRSLARLMLEDVLASLAAVLEPTRWLIVTVDPDAVAIARRYRAHTLADGACDGHTNAVMTAARMLAGEGADGFLTLPGDIPRVMPAEIVALLKAHRPGRAFTIAPSHDEQGSNAIICSPPDAVPLRFGDYSFYPHLDAARGAGIEPTIVPLEGVAMDIDTPDDVARFLRMEPRVETHALRFLEAILSGRTVGAKGKTA